MPAAIPTEINVVFTDPERCDATLDVIDFHPYEPSAYCTDPGYTAILCLPEREVEFFVSLDGTVYEQPENLAVGHAPALRQEVQV